MKTYIAVAILGILSACSPQSPSSNTARESGPCTILGGKVKGILVPVSPNSPDYGRHFCIPEADR